MAPSRPLTAHARAVLAEIEKAPVPASTVNPGVRTKLINAGFAEIVQLPSPYKTVRGQINFLRRANQGGAAT